MGVPEISGQCGKALLDVLACAIPMHKGPDSKSMTKVVQARSVAIELAAQPDPP
jgi:hypothetical protein